MNYYVPQDGEDGVMLQELIQQKNAGVEPKAGDLALYIPWGNIAAFCEDFRQSDQLIPIGKVESGQEVFDNLSPPTKELMKLTLEERLAHGGHPVLRQMMDDILIRTDPAGNIKADKEKSIEKFENETVQQTYAKVKNLITRSCEISDFSYDLFVSKINAINSILANQTLCDLNQKPEEDNKKNQKLETEIEELQKLKDSASQRAKDIKDVVEELAKDEYEKVGPALGKFYNKLIRFNSSDGINIVQDLLMEDFQNEDICGQHKNRIGCSFLQFWNRL